MLKKLTLKGWDKKYRAYSLLRIKWILICIAIVFMLTVFDFIYFVVVLGIFTNGNFLYAEAFEDFFILGVLSFCGLYFFKLYREKKG